MSERRPLWERLIDTEAARDAYLGRTLTPSRIRAAWFGAIVDAVRAAEERGLDPVAVLRDAVLGLCRVHDAQSEALADTMNRTIASVLLPRAAAGSEGTAP